VGHMSPCTVSCHLVRYPFLISPRFPTDYTLVDF